MNSPKYNRTFHLPWSEGCTSDDKRASDVKSLLNVPIVITEKMDGSNTSLERAGCFARTHAGPPTHASFDGLKVLHATVQHQIPEDFQLFGEWLYAKHSIGYSKLPCYFLLFNVRQNNIPERLRDPMFTCLSEWFAWDEVKLWAEEIRVSTVPVLFEGQLNSEKELKDMISALMKMPSACGGEREGVVVRVARNFNDDEFSNCVMKAVRANHVQTDEHWRNQEIVKNLLAEKEV